MKELAATDLYRAVDESTLDFETTDELEPLESTLGQPRVVAAAEFGIGIEHEGFNIYALGSPGLGKKRTLRRFLERHAESAERPADICYVNDFEEGHRARALLLPPGRGRSLRDDMDELVEELQTALTAAFESEEYQTRRQAIDQELKERQGHAFEELQEKAKEEDLAVMRTPGGMAFAPVKDGEVLSPEEFEELPEEEREELEGKVDALQEELQEIVRQVPTWQKERREKLQELNREMIEFAVGPLIDELKERYDDLPEVLSYLEAVEEDVVENAPDFVGGGEQEKQQQQLRQLLGGAFGGDDERPALRRYRVNLLVGHDEDEGAPVVYEDNPTYQNLIGRIEHLPRMGALITDFNMIQPGALHRANGGYLMLDAIQLLRHPLAWDGLKRALESGVVKIESPARTLGLVSTISLEPEPVPIDVKVVIVGSRLIYYLLSAYDRDFDQLFKVAADFAESTDRDDGIEGDFARFVARIVVDEELRPFESQAVGRVIEESARMAGDGERLSLEVIEVRDLVCEADHWASQNGSETVSRADVDRAVQARIYRSDRVRERIQDEIERGTLLVSTEGEAVGQINGLSVLQLAGFAFGRPNRITARARLGKGEVVDIEREVKLSGPLHSKGVLILKGFLGARYAEETPLSLSASLVFEQSYGGVDGDSASLAELVTLLSAIAEVPIEQSLAVTGSVNQHGEVQAIGGVNEKIEGFFDVCARRGLTGEQGVVIPESNSGHLMLADRVVEAVEQGSFHVWTVGTVDEAIEVLTRMESGERDEEGEYREGSFNRRVEDRLRELAETRRKFAAKGKTRGEDEDEAEEEEDADGETS